MSHAASSRRRRLLTGGLLSLALTASLLVAVPLTAMSGAVPAEAATAVALHTSSPFVSNAKKKVWYRIPAFAASKRKLYAFAERRDNNTSSDVGKFDIDMSTSTNNGKTWSRVKTIIHEKGQASNPVATVAANGTVVLVASTRRTIVKKNGTVTHPNMLQVRTSADGFAKKRTIDMKIASGLSGPGTGILITQGAHKGRIIIPASYQSGTKYGARLLYSDNNGATWTAGPVALGPKNTSIIEGQGAELADGALFLSYHDKRTKNRGTLKNRWYTYAKADGTIQKTWKRLTVPVTSAQTSFIVPKTGSSANAKRLFMVAPSYTTSSDPTLRRVEAIYVSNDRGKTWPVKYEIELENTPAAYSSIVQLDGNTFGVIYETGKRTWRERIRFTSVRISTVLHVTRVKSTITHKRLHTTGVWIQVHAKGATSPWGNVTLTYTNVKRDC